MPAQLSARQGPFQVVPPDPSGELWSAQQVADALGLRHSWQADRLFCLGHLAGQSLPNGRNVFFSGSVQQFAADGLPNCVPRYGNEDEFLTGTQDERALSKSFDERLTGFVSKRPMSEKQQREFFRERGSSGYRYLSVSADLQLSLGEPVDESSFSIPRIPSHLQSSESAPLSELGSVGTAVLGFRLRQELYYQSTDRPHLYPGGLLAGLFRSQKEFNARITEGFDALGQKRFGYCPGKYKLQVDGPWNPVTREYDTKEVDLNITESVLAADLLKCLDRRAIVQAAL